MASDNRQRLVPLPQPATPQELVHRARLYGPACIDTLAEIAVNGTDSARISATNALLDRGFGKAGQVVDLAGKDETAARAKTADTADTADTAEAPVSPAVAAALKAINALDS